MYCPSIGRPKMPSSSSPSSAQPTSTSGTDEYYTRHIGGDSRSHTPSHGVVGIHRVWQKPEGEDHPAITSLGSSDEDEDADKDEVESARSEDMDSNGDNQWLNHSDKKVRRTYSDLYSRKKQEILGKEDTVEKPRPQVISPSPDEHEAEREKNFENVMESTQREKEEDIDDDDDNVEITSEQKHSSSASNSQGQLSGASRLFYTSTKASTTVNAPETSDFNAAFPRTGVRFGNLARNGPADTARNSSTGYPPIPTLEQAGKKYSDKVSTNKRPRSARETENRGEERRTKFLHTQRCMGRTQRCSPRKEAGTPASSFASITSYTKSSAKPSSESNSHQGLRETIGKTSESVTKKRSPKKKQNEDLIDLVDDENESATVDVHASNSSLTTTKPSDKELVDEFWPCLTLRDDVLLKSVNAVVRTIPVALAAAGR
eukprot:gb/GECG01015170.1/.p1 GENE.gb/GECG01015170.1/~~gb/GECG01015170.1/.p1  ORF type:complete len:431 (+),score=72.93 gb/GECG01015170.1/:1-1293(+)